MILHFGKYRGKSIHEVPRSYLRWLNEQPWFSDEHPWLASEVRLLLGTSESTAEGTRSTAITTDVLKSWRRSMLARWHPDKPGGSHAAFLAVSDAVESLGAMLAAKGVSA